MLRKKIATLILVATITNLASAPLSTLAETLTTDNVQQEENIQQENKTKVSRFDVYYSKYKDAYD